MVPDAGSAAAVDQVERPVGGCPINAEAERPMVTPDLSNFVTWPGLTVALKPLEEIRTTLFARQTLFEEALGSLRAEVAEMRTEITRRQDELHGLATGHEQQIGQIDERLSHVETYGCAQRAADVNLLKQIASANVLDAEPAQAAEIEPPVEIAGDLKVEAIRRFGTRRTAIVAAWIGLGMVIMAVLPYLHRLLDFFRVGL